MSMPVELGIHLVSPAYFDLYLFDGAHNCTTCQPHTGELGKGLDLISCIPEHFQAVFGRSQVIARLKGPCSSGTINVFKGDLIEVLVDGDDDYVLVNVVERMDDDGVYQLKPNHRGTIARDCIGTYVQRAESAYVEAIKVSRLRFVCVCLP